MFVYCLRISWCVLLLTDTQSLTDAINNTGRVYEEIDGQQVSSVLVHTVYHMLQCVTYMLTCSDPIM